MDVEITTLDGVKTKLSDIGVEARDFIVGSIELRPTYATIDGRSGHVNMGADYGTRTIRVPFYFKAKDLHDVVLLRDELFGLVSELNPFYIREMRRLHHHPGIVLCDDPADGREYKVNDYDNLYVGGERYKVRLSSTFDIDQVFEYGFGELVFETTDLPFAESIGTTQFIERNGITSEDEIWGFGMGLKSVEESLKYTFTDTSFYVFNAGNVPVHPFEQDLKITISDVISTGSIFILLNRTNGSIFQINDAIDINQTIVVDGPNVTSNGLQYLRKTSRRYVELSTGWNEFIVLGASKVKIEFDFRYYYR